MLYKSTDIMYPLLTLLSIGKKSFERMGVIIQRSGDTVKRLLQPASYSFLTSQTVAKKMFVGKKNIYICIDDTMINKIYSKVMQGSGMFFDTKIGRRIMAYKLMIGIVTDGKFAVPISCAYLFSNELLERIDHKFPAKDDIAKSFVETVIKLFPDTKITVVVDGLYSTIKFLRWCKDNNIRVEARMHSNRMVEYNGKRMKVSDLPNIQGVGPRGRQMAHTIPVIWHGMSLELTIVKRLDKHDVESIVFQVATHKAQPREHVASYKKRWAIEMLNRTVKQEIGLQDCYSCDLKTQENHAASVLLAYALAQFEMKVRRLNTPEQAIRHIKQKNVNFLVDRFISFLHNDFQFFA